MYNLVRSRVDASSQLVCWLPIKQVRNQSVRLPAHRRSQILLSHNRSVGFTESVYVTVYWYVFSGVPPPLRPPQQMYTVTFTISSALYDSCQLRPCRSNELSCCWHGRALLHLLDYTVKGHSSLQGQHFRYQSKARMPLPISE